METPKLYLGESQYYLFGLSTSCLDFDVPVEIAPDSSLF